MVNEIASHDDDNLVNRKVNLHIFFCFLCVFYFMFLNFILYIYGIILKLQIHSDCDITNLKSNKFFSLRKDRLSLCKFHTTGLNHHEISKYEKIGESCKILLHAFKNKSLHTSSSCMRPVVCKFK